MSGSRFMRGERGEGMQGRVSNPPLFRLFTPPGYDHPINTKQLVPKLLLGNVASEKLPLLFQQCLRQFLQGPFSISQNAKQSFAISGFPSGNLGTRIGLNLITYQPITSAGPTPPDQYPDSLSRPSAYRRLYSQQGNP